MSAVPSSFEAQAILRFSHEDGYGFRLAADLRDPDIAYLKRALAPRELDLQGTRYAPHISVVRHEKPDRTLWDRWAGRLNGRDVLYRYETRVYDDGVYFWVRAHSEPLSAIRQVLGLAPHSPWSRPPDGSPCFHITIANRKGRQG